jgi:hypothetical protein
LREFSGETMQRLLRVVASTWLAIAVCITMAAAQPQPVGDPKAFAEAFFSRVLNNPDAAFALIREETPLGRSGQLSVALEQLRTLLRNNGLVHSYEFIGEQKLGTTLRRYEYVLNQRVKPAVFRLTFYNVQNGWQLINMQFTDNVDNFPFR